VSAAKHTPGPWRLDAHNNVMHKDGLVAFPCISGGFPQEANARLIAAAPELLEALQVLMEKCIDPKEFRYLKAGIGTRAPKGKALLAALAAIAKATGEAA